MEGAEKLRFWEIKRIFACNRLRITVVYSRSDWKSEKFGGTLGLLILTITIIRM